MKILRHVVILFVKRQYSRKTIFRIDKLESILLFKLRIFTRNERDKFNKNIQ